MNRGIVCSLLVLPLHTDDTDHCDQQHSCKHRQGAEKCKVDLITLRAFVLAFVPIVPPVISCHAPRDIKKKELGAEEQTWKNLAVYLVLNWQPSKQNDHCFFRKHICANSFRPKLVLYFNLMDLMGAYVDNVRMPHLIHPPHTHT